MRIGVWVARIAFAIIAGEASGFAQPTGSGAHLQPTIAERYELADKALGIGNERLSLNADLQPVFTADGHALIYRPGILGKRDVSLLDLRTGSSRILTHEATLATLLSHATGKEVAPWAVQLESPDYAAGTFQFGFMGKRWTLDDAGTLKEAPAGPPQGDGARSPDGRFEIFARNYNLVARDTRSGREVALTSDGDRERPYGRTLPLLSEILTQGTEEPKMPVSVRWSPDGRSIATFRLDTRGVAPLTMTQENPGGLLPRSFRYIYLLAGAAAVPQVTLYTVDVERALKRRRARLVPLAVPAESLLYPTEPYYGWDGNLVRSQWTERGYGKLEVFHADPETGAATVVAREAIKPLVTVTATQIWPAPDLGGELVVSERSGWAQLYLVRPDDPDGGLPLTRGPGEVTGVARADTPRTLLLTGNGRERDRNPYYRALYRVALDGSQPRLLTPEPLDHDTQISPDGRWFVDTMSSPTTPTVTLLRSAIDGRIVATLGQADPAALSATGFTVAEPFRGVAADGKTPLYGIIWRPANFDPARRYPIIDFAYTGPTTHIVPQSWQATVRSAPASVAQLGAIVVSIDARGTSGRGQAFRLPAYQNLGEVGLDDHIAMIRQMAARYPYIDLDRVGVFGMSAGGYDAARFILRRPEFFKVAVAGAGNHELRLDKAWWPEVSMGLASPELWERNSNMSVAGNLVGKLLLVHGDVDDNVPVVESFRLASELIARRRDVDVVILPNTSHNVFQPYFWRKLREYFVRNLLGETPPPLPLPNPRPPENGKSRPAAVQPH
ncbi:MAG: prolyl oligopeptidase family serine peptidase [Sphingomonas phyllosphaerae]|uniref:S9 family peptidase n=1 Tax=Sphingomonas phyllosphaerae TaxID=257003 RepID=UPI002FF7A6CE